MIRFDLHMHSIYSYDGEYTPKQLIQKAKDKGLEYIALSDHDSMKGIDEMISLGKEENIKVIPAIEFDTLFEGLEIDLLGYNFNYHKEFYENLDKYIDELMSDVVLKRIELFNKTFDLDLTLEEVLEKANGKVAFNAIVELMLEHPKTQDLEIFKPYRENGARCDAPIPNFYWDYCSSNKPFYVGINYPSFKEIVARIHEDGGIAVLAHPWNTFYKNEELLKKAIECGIDGIEAYSNYHSKEQNEYYEKFAKEHNLIITCGSDYHGTVKPRIEIGEFGYTKDDSEQILDSFLKAIHKGE